MIVGTLLKIILVIIAISSIHIAYNAIVYRKSGAARWVKFAFLIAAVVVALYLSFQATDKLVAFPYINGVINAVDSVFLTFWGYLPNAPLFIWFVIPFILTWIVYLFMTVTTVVRYRHKYYKWKQKVEAEEKQDSAETNQSSQGVKSAKETTVQSPAMDQPTKQNDVHFLSEPTVKIRYKSVLGLQRAYETSKSKGLQLAESETGYVAVYANKSGVQKLKHILSENGIDHSSLKNRPSIVFFNLDNMQCITIKEAFERMKGGQSIV